MQAEGIQMKQDELSNQLKNQALETVSPAAFLQVGGPVFPDDTTVSPLHALSQIVTAYQAVHLPAFGQPIPKTGAVVSVDGAENLLVPTKSQVAKVEYISFTNLGGAAPIIATLTLGGMNIGFPADYSTAITIPPSTTFSYPVSIVADVNLPLVVAVTSGTAAELTTKAAYVLLSQ